MLVLDLRWLLFDVLLLVTAVIVLSVILWRERERREQRRAALLNVEAVRAVVQGMTNREIGRELHIAERTVEYHVHKILRRVGAASRVEAPGLAFHLGSRGALRRGASRTNISCKIPWFQLHFLCYARRRSRSACAACWRSWRSTHAPRQRSGRWAMTWWSEKGRVFPH